MATQVNRIPFNTIPKAWAFDPVIGPFIRELMTIVWQSRERMGGDSDTISTVVVQSEDTLFAAIESRVARLEEIVSSLSKEHEFNTRLAAIESQIESLARETAIPKPDQSIDTDMQNTLVYGLIERINAIEAQL